MELPPVRANVHELQVVVEAAITHESASVLSSLELSSTSNSNYSSPQSPRTTRSFSSPILSDQSLPIDVIHPAPAHNASSRARPQFLPRAQAMASLMEGVHALILQELKKSEKGHQSDASKHKKRLRRLSKEIYVIVSMYALLQGVLFVAVAQSNAFMCEDWWGPAAMAGGVMLGTLWGVVDKLRRMGLHKAQVKKSERCQSSVYDKIELLYSCGSGCPIDGNLEPQISKDLPSCPALLSPRGMLVLGFLVGFSILNIASCKCMLCQSNSH